MKFKKLLIFCFSMLLFSANAVAQSDPVVSGKVTDETGMAIPGATITVKGTNTATVSDLDGNFSIAVPSSGTIVITYIGFGAMEVPVEGRSVINVELSTDSQALEEVVVVGYGTQRKSVVTGAISSVKAADIENLGITRIEQALQGRASGLTITTNSGQPGSNSTIRVRGITSFGNNEPLWVVDGIIVDAGGIGFLNQADIASIEVLKDAASQAIYGTRAAAGVILITTKKGKAGTLNVTYNGYTGFSSAARKLDLVNATQYATLRNESSVAAGGEILYADPASLGNGTDWQDAIFTKGAKREGHEVSVSGGNEKSTFYASFGMIDQHGIVATDISKYIRKNFRLNSTHKISDYVTIGQTVGYSHEKNVGLGNTNNEYGGPLSSAINLDPLTPLVVTDPTVANSAPYSTNAGIITDANGNPYGISGVVVQEITNPLAYIETRRGNFNWADNFVGNVFLEAVPLKGLTFRSTLGAKMAFYGYESFTPVSFLNSSTITAQNNISTGNNRGFGWNFENTLAYSSTINSHNFTALIGQGVYTDDISKGTSVTYFNIPGTNFENAAFPSSHPEEDKVSSAYRSVEHRVTSIFARLNYDYKEKYLLTGIIRRDGSSRFGENNRFGIFPSVSVGWVVSKEGFWKENNTINTLKIRGGYGTVGSDALPNFAFLSSIGGGRNYTFGTTGSYVVGFSPDRPSNPDLQWEETSQTNIGFESRFLNNFDITFDWYKKVTDKLLRESPIPDYIGAISDPIGNIGEIENSGFEIELGYRGKIGNVNVGVNANASLVRNEVKYLGIGTGTTDPYIDGPGFQTLGSITRTEAGHAYNEFYGYQTAGIFQNQAEVDAYVNESGGLIQPNASPGDFRFRDNNGDGAITADDRTYIGNPTPDYTYGITFNLDYKNFDFMVLGQGVAGNQIFQGLRRLDIPGANYQSDALNRWTGEGTSTDYPRLVDGDPNGNFSKFSDFYLQDGDYFRLKVVQLGYTIAKEVTMKAKIQRVRLYLTGENLLTFTKYTGYDPEIGGGTLSIDRGQYPQARTIMFGANLEF